MIALDAALQRASAEIAAGRFREAEARLIDVVAGDPGNVAALSRLGDVRVVQKDFAEAERALLQALSVAQGHGRAPVLWRLAGMERRRGNYDRALDYYRQYSGIAPLSGRTVERMAATLLDAGRRDEAERALREWLADHPASLVGLQALARLLRDEGRDEEAQEMWRLILGIRPNDEEARAALSAAGGGE
jgi:tetratricopeptide (TPR) repeat protein